ncbi:HAMP domain-containing histidine kinase [Paenibacillus hemerocallicola]|uniref:histidine kinase n=1 Tax=Paenibacillus hemerocallicola TaxID=1172614 RepID=A0A5C4T4L5_9BACL|nr:sensor histidine kinase [Paenibacillus hemerocallicola]TNJ63973.1 HAMP domain-containing histidine kinase [Paenibacillus hemerocallicola]
MTLFTYMKDRLLLIVLHVVCMVLLAAFLRLVGNDATVILLIIFIWTLIIAAYFTVHFVVRQSFFDRLSELSNSLEQRYLIAEVMDRPVRMEDVEYYRLIKAAGKSMTEHVTEVRGERKEYKEYIEQWVHEIKTPIAAIQLMCDNHKSDVTRKILMELEKTDQYVEQALYYARCEQVEKDYLIKEMSLSECVHSAILKNKQLLIQNGIQIQTEQLDRTVYSDSKWIEFIVNQLLLNAVKYRKQRQEASTIAIYAEAVRNGVGLVIRDDGIGIVESELPRLFELGFTGSNGRHNQKSTGIGLYLCKRLCDKLGLEIAISSIRNEYTAVTIFFPIGTLYKVQG